MACARSPAIDAAMTASRWFSIRRTSRLCYAPSARPVSRRAAAVWSWLFLRARSCWSGPSPMANRLRIRSRICFSCSIATAPAPCAALFARLLSAIRRVPLRSSSCCASPIAPPRCRLTSDAIPKPKASKFARTIWRPTMNSLNDTTKKTPNPNPNLREQLERIGLTAVAAQLDDMLAHAARQRWSPRQLLDHLAQIEVAERAHRSIERDVIERALTLDFLPEARNLVLVGANGLGKTMIAQNICNAAVLAGHSVLFRTASKLLTDLHRQTPEGRLRKLRAYANVGLLCIDEVGYLSFDDKSADLLYEVINQRYEQ